MLTELHCSNMTDEELLRYCDRSVPEIKELAERLEREKNDRARGLNEDGISGIDELNGRIDRLKDSVSKECDLLRMKVNNFGSLFGL